MIASATANALRTMRGERYRFTRTASRSNTSGNCDGSLTPTMMTRINIVTTASVTPLARTWSGTFRNTVATDAAYRTGCT